MDKFAVCVFYEEVGHPANVVEQHWLIQLQTIQSICETLLEKTTHVLFLFDIRSPGTDIANHDSTCRCKKFRKIQSVGMIIQ